MATTTFSIQTNPTNGILSSFNSFTGDVTYTPNNNYSGSDSFTYNILCDGLIVDTATVSITIASQTGVQSITNASGGVPILDPKCGQAIVYKSTTIFTPASPTPSPISYAWTTNNVGAVVTNGNTDTATVTFVSGLTANVDVTCTQITPFETLVTTITVSVKCANAVNDVVSTNVNTPLVIQLSNGDIICN